LQLSYLLYVGSSTTQDESLAKKYRRVDPLPTIDDAASGGVGSNQSSDGAATGGAAVNLAYMQGEYQTQFSQPEKGENEKNCKL
jgi:hypothetical protein